MSTGDISRVFADTYEVSYNSVSYDKDDTVKLVVRLNYLIVN